MRHRSTAAALQIIVCLTCSRHLRAGPYDAFGKTASISCEPAELHFRGCAAGARQVVEFCNTSSTSVRVVVVPPQSSCFKARGLQTASATDACLQACSLQHHHPVLANCILQLSWQGLPVLQQQQAALCCRLLTKFVGVVWHPGSLSVWWWSSLGKSRSTTTTESWCTHRCVGNVFECNHMGFGHLITWYQKPVTCAPLRG